jgi:hypothetical protein
MTVAPTDATAITVLDTLHKLDDDFGAMATALESGEFALWVGSGISRKAPSLGTLVTRAVEFLRQRTADPATSAKFRPALASALKYGGVTIADVDAHLGEPFSQWPNYKSVRDALWNRYSELLDVRLQGEANDFMLWDAVDVREAFSHPAPPTCEHLSIAILILEGALQEIASANWDGFIEAAVEQLAGTIAGNLQVVVDANVRAASFGELGVALALLADGQSGGLWQLTGPTDADLPAGALTSTATWAGAQPRTIFFVRTAKVALDLQKRGAFANDNTIVIRADDAWH